MSTTTHIKPVVGNFVLVQVGAWCPETGRRPGTALGYVQKLDGENVWVRKVKTDGAPKYKTPTKTRDTEIWWDFGLYVPTASAVKRAKKVLPSSCANAQ